MWTSACTRARSMSNMDEKQTSHHVSEQDDTKFDGVLDPATFLQSKITMGEQEELLWNVASPAHFSPLRLLSGGGRTRTFPINLRPDGRREGGAKKDGNYSEETER